MDTNEINVSDILDRMSVDWTGYIPPGGVEWQHNFDEFIVPEIDEKMSNAIEKGAELKRKAEFYESMMDGLGKAKAGVEKAINSICSVERSFGADENGKESPVWSLLSMSSELDSMIDDANEKYGNDIQFDKLNEEFSFLYEFKSYFLKDRIIDKVLWALGKVDVKYRTKVIRKLIRLISEQMSRYDSIKTATCSCADEYRERFKGPLAEVSACYPVVDKAMRLLYKRIKEQGMASFEKFYGDIPDMMVRSVHPF